MIHDSAHQTERLQAVLIGRDGKVKTVRQVGTVDHPVPVLVRRPQQQKQSNEKKQ